MAERLIQASLKDSDDWRVVSVGISAVAGGKAAPHAVAAMAEEGLDLADHGSKKISRQLVDLASMIVVMTQRHKSEIVRLYSASSKKVFLLNEFAETGVFRDIDDPFGGSLDLYRAVRDQMKPAVSGLVDFLKNVNSMNGDKQ